MMSDHSCAQRGGGPLGPQRLKLFTCLAFACLTIPGCEDTSRPSDRAAGAPSSGIVEEHKKAAAALRKLGGHVSIDKAGQPRAAVLNGAQVDDEALASLSGMTGLSTLHITKASITSAGLGAIRKLRGLTHLQIYGCGGLTDDGLNHLSGLTRLERLWLLDNAITDAGLRHLAALDRLSELRLSGEDIAGNGLEHLKALSRLSELHLSGPKITGAGLQHLGELAHLKTLKFSGVNVANDGMEHLSGLSSLKFLILADTMIDDDGLIPLIELPELEKLIVRGTNVSDAGLEHLEKMKALTAVDLMETRVTLAGARRLMKARPSLGVTYNFPR